MKDVNIPEGAAGETVSIDSGGSFVASVPADESSGAALQKNLGAYTQGSIERTMLKTALTMLPATLALSGYNIADSYFVGQLKDAGAMAAMSNTGSVVMLVGCVFMGVGTGIMANLAHALGRGDREMSQKLVGSGLFLACLCAVTLGIAGILSTDFIFGWLGAEGETLVKTKQYMNIWFLGSFTSVLAMEGNTLLITAGIPKLASLMSIVGLVVNIILDPIFIFGWWKIPAMGITGAALATVFSQAVSGLVNVIILHRQRLLVFRRIPWAELFGLWRKIVQYAVPATLGMLLMPVAMYITTRYTYELSKLIGYGDDLVAGIGQASRLELIAFVVPMSLGRALMPMIGQNYGARLYSRVKQCFKFSLCFAQGFLLAMAFLWCFLFKYFAPYLAPGQPRVQDVMILFMRIAPFGFGCLESMRFCGFTIMGCGHPRTDGVIKILRVMLLQIPLSWLALQMVSMKMLIVARLLTDIASFLIAFSAALYYIRKLPADGECMYNIMDAPHNNL